jgi:paraquat-inducible protein B
MMSTASTSFKLGLFTLLALAAVAVIASVLGLRKRHDKTVEYHSYFDESVVGLDVGAPVKLRGITVGTVMRVGFAADGHLVDVASAVKLEDSPRLAWDPAKDNGLRAQLTSQGITGVKLIDLDVVDPKTHPPPRLPFPPAPHYVPATKSLLTQIEEGVANAVESLPEMVDTTVVALRGVEKIVREVDEHAFPRRVRGTLQNVDLAVKDLRGIMRRINKGDIPEQSAATLDRLDAAIESFGHVMEQLDRDGGLLSSTQQAAQAFGQAGKNAAGTVQDLDTTLREVGDAARAIRDVADALDRDPDMLLKGRSKARSQ